MLTAFFIPPKSVHAFKATKLSDSIGASKCAETLCSSTPPPLPKTIS